MTPRAAHRTLSRVRLPGPELSAFGAGALTVLAFAPFDMFLLPLLTLALLFRLWLDSSSRGAFRLGWLFGLGFMGFGVFWLHISIDQFGNVGTPLAIAITLAFVLFIALYFGLAGWLGQVTEGGREVQLLLVFPAVWCLIEWLRGWMLTGFPWLALGYSQIDSPLAGYVPVIGVYGGGWLLAVSAGLLVLVWLDRRLRLWWGGAFALIWVTGLLLQQPAWTRPAGEPLQVSLVQANIPQELKWSRPERIPTLEKYTKRTRESRDSDLVIWPETAVPDFLHQVDDAFLQPLAQEMGRHGVHLLVGVPVLNLETGLYYNGAVVLGANEYSAYFKRHLVPFGEFLPFRTLLGPLLEFMEIPMSNFAAGDHRRPLVQVGDTPVGISICYEDAFGSEVAQALPDAAYLVNMSNDAWFGDSLAPHQHLQIARMRALETGRPLLRATNTGISALIGARGEVLAATSAFEETVLRGEIQPMGGSTPFVRTGNTAVIMLMLAAFGIGFWRHRLRKGRGNK